MQVLHERFQDDPTVAILAVNTDDGADPRPHMADGGFSYRMVPAGGAVAELYGVDRIPTFVVVGADGRVIHRRVGSLNDASRDELERVARGD